MLSENPDTAVQRFYRATRIVVAKNLRIVQNGGIQAGLDKSATTAYGVLQSGGGRRRIFDGASPIRSLPELKLLNRSSW
jgi:hypothetical protein